ncbi:MAG: restriction endonuclease subunit S [Alistipes sp.]
MKQGWEIKKLGEVATFCSGYTPKEAELMGCGDVPYFKVSDMNHPINTKYLQYTSLFLESGCKTFSKYTIVFPKNGAAIATNKKRILLQDSVVDLNTGGACANKGFVIYEYLYLYFLNIDFRLHTRKGTVPTLDIAELKQLPIPVPPLAEQKRIVAELDCLNGIIEKKKEQLKELDLLAQSIFYTMFGDPITNEKGWEVKKFEDCHKLASGNGLSAKDMVEGVYPVYGGNGIVGYHNEYNLEGNNIIIGRVGALCGNVRNVVGKAFITG